MVIKILIVDDSQVMRGVLTNILSLDPEIKILGTATNAQEAREAIKKLNPDVITLDVEMPGMDGIAFLEKVMMLRPMPVIMVSTLTHKNAYTTIRALEIGAVECVGKPAAGLSDNAINEFAKELIAKVKMAAASRVISIAVKNVPKKSLPNSSSISKNGIIGIGASTGGIQALHAILAALPAEIPPIVITQHIQDSFIPAFVERLKKICHFPVVEVTKDMSIDFGKAYVASSGMHTEIIKKGNIYYCIRRGKESVSGHLPSVDVMFKSLAINAGKEAIGIILTGMGRDGAEGLLAMKRAGAYTIGQNAATSVVYGMPRAAYELGAVEKELALEAIAPEILNIISKS